MPSLPHLPTAQASRAWPSLCALCKTWCKGGLCPACHARYATPQWRCACCALRLPTPIHPPGQPNLWPHPRPEPLDACLSAVDYTYPWQDLLHAYKFRADLRWRHLMAALLQVTLDAATDVWAALGAAPDVMVPMPLSDQRWRERGYHQTALLAQALTPHVPWPCDTGVLRRVGHRRAQMTLGMAARRHNIAGAFALAPEGLGPWRGRHVLLLDDVATTLSTGREAAAVLKHGGARCVTLLTLARTP